MVCINIFWVNGPTPHNKMKLILEDQTSVLQFKKRVVRVIMEKVKLNTDHILDENIDSEISVILGDGSFLTKKEDYLTLADLCREDTLNVIALTRHCGLASVALVHKIFHDLEAKPTPVVHAKFDLAKDTIATVKKHILALGQIGPSPTPYLILKYGGSEFKESDTPLCNILNSFQNIISYYIKKPMSGTIDIYVKTLTGKKICLKVGPYVLVEDAKLMVQEKEGIPADQQRLIFCGIQMEDMKMLAEYGVNKGSYLHLILKLRGGGDGSFAGVVGLPAISFADISDKRNMVERQFSKSAPFWRTVHKGLNLEGICENSVCEAYKQQVICNWKLPNFHLRNDSAEVCCPICEVTLKSVLTCGFSSTFWRYYGRKSDAISVLMSSDWQEAKDSYTTFEVNKSEGGLKGMGNWNLLVIETRQRLEDDRGYFQCPTHCGFCFQLWGG